jgi:hypothetical protein
LGTRLFCRVTICFYKVPIASDCESEGAGVSYWYGEIISGAREKKVTTFIGISLGKRKILLRDSRKESEFSKIDGVHKIKSLLI